jgi:hypothetical protein
MERVERIFAIALVAVVLGACVPSVVRRVDGKPITADASLATLVVVHPPRTTAGPVWFVDAEEGGAPPRIVGALETQSHFVVRLRPGRHLLVAYDDRSYDGVFAEVAPGQVYLLETYDPGGSELVVRPVDPYKENVRRMLDETDRVELLHPPSPSETETMQRKVELARFRVKSYGEAARRAHELGPAHASH